ncbi:MAG: T9SS type A sorting domain-containing protein [Melioribacteraceae bacterium]
MNNGNSWVYEVTTSGNIHNFTNNTDSLFYDMYSLVYKIVGDTTISVLNSNPYKIIKVKLFKDILIDGQTLYFYSNATIFSRVNYEYGSIYWSTLFDTKVKKDTSWSGYHMGGTNYYGSIKLLNTDIFNGNIDSQRLEGSAYYGTGLGGKTVFLTAKKYGIIEMYEESNVASTGIRRWTETMQKLVGCVIEGKQYGKLEPPEIASFSINNANVEINYKIPAYNSLSKIMIYLYSLENQKYILSDSVETNSTKINKPLPVGNYNLRITYKDQAGIESTFSNEVTFSVIPERFNIYQNYPNPFNSKTIIKFTTTEKSKVVLNVFNILGQLVYEDKKEVSYPGIYEFNLEPKGLSSGVYLYRVMNHNNQVITNKMVLLK